jgi:hypothetical protein
MNSKTARSIRLGLATVLMASPLALMPGCEEVSNITDTLCCTKFKPGTNMLNVDWGLEAETNLQFGVTMQAIGDLNGAATAMLTDLGTLCRNLAVELGTDPKAVTTQDPGEYTKQWCAEAVTAITDVKAAAAITIEFQEARCSFSAEVQADCEATCQVDVSCNPGSIEARCTGGEITGKCNATCMGSCEGSASLAVSCQGTCSGECEGTCMGTQNGSQCEGTCDGQCRGSCSATPPSVSCEGECTGECSVAFVAPKCTAELEPPACEGDANCQGSCSASASAKAECTPPAVSVVGSAEFSTQIGVLKKYLPEIILIGQARAEILLDSAGAVVEAAANIEGDLSAEAALCIIPASAAIADTAVSICVSLHASGDVLASIQ